MRAAFLRGPYSLTHAVPRLAAGSQLALGCIIRSASRPLRACPQVCEVYSEPAMRSWVAEPPSRRAKMAQPLQAESPVLLKSIEDGKADLVGRFHYVALVRSRPRTLSTWGVTVVSARTGDRIAQLLGGRVQEDRTGDQVEILTTSSTIDILLSGPNALHLDWRRDETNICDDASQDDRESCKCPADFQLRRTLAKQGGGCRPLAEVHFRLLDDQTAGVFGL